MQISLDTRLLEIREYEAVKVKIMRIIQLLYEGLKINKSIIRDLV